jgi:hypothetical protein
VTAQIFEDFLEFIAELRKHNSASALSCTLPGSARVPPVWRARPRDREFPSAYDSPTNCRTRKDRFGETPKPARETHALSETSSAFISWVLASEL